MAKKKNKNAALLRSLALSSLAPTPDGRDPHAIGPALDRELRVDGVRKDRKVPTGDANTKSLSVGSGHGLPGPDLVQTIAKEFQQDCETTEARADLESLRRLVAKHERYHVKDVTAAVLHHLKLVAELDFPDPLARAIVASFGSSRNSRSAGN